MASHKDLSTRNQAHDDRTVHLGGLQFKMSREEIAAAVSSHGFQGCVFYWPAKEAKFKHHTGWCFVEFADATTANSAQEKLDRAQFGGRPVKANRPSKGPRKAPSGQPKPSSSGQPDLSSTVGQSGVSAITKKVANVALSSKQQAESRASYTAGVRESDEAWRKEAAAVVDKPGANMQGPEATVANAKVEHWKKPGVERDIKLFVHPFSISPTAQAKLDLEATRLNSYSEAWGVKKDAPPSADPAREAIHDRCMVLDKAYMAAGVRSGFPFSRIIDTEIPDPISDPSQTPRVVDNSGLLARQFPNPASANDETAQSMPVLMIKMRVVDEDPSGKEPIRRLLDMKLAPLHDLEAHMVDGWYPYVQRVPNEADVDKQCDRVIDVKTTDQPWKDTERQFERGITATNYPGGSQWFPGAVLDRPVVDNIPQGNLSFSEVKCISNMSSYRNQGETGADLRTATNWGHVAIKKRPQNIGMGWGGYDDFHQWQANGRKIEAEYVQQRDWQFDVRKMVVVEEGSGKETKFNVPEGSALDEFISATQNGDGTLSTDLKSLFRVLNPGKPSQKSYNGGRGGGEW